jgi:hypothetical protein
VAALLNESVIELELWSHGPPGSSVEIVNITDPANISAGLGVYVVMGAEGKLKTPVPEVFHSLSVAEPPILP